MLRRKFCKCRNNWKQLQRNLQTDGFFNKQLNEHKVCIITFWLFFQIPFVWHKLENFNDAHITFFSPSAEIRIKTTTYIYNCFSLEKSNRVCIRGQNQVQTHLMEMLKNTITRWQWDCTYLFQFSNSCYIPFLKQYFINILI